MTLKNIKKILVIKLRHIGDVLLSAPVFRALRQSFPDAHVSALVNSGTETVLAGNPFIDNIIVFDREIKKMNLLKRYGKEFRFLQDLRAKGFDMTVDLTGGDRAAIISFFSGAIYRLGWRPDKGFAGKKHLYTHLSDPDGSKHMVLQNLAIVGKFGIRAEDTSVDFHIPEADRQYVRQILEQYNINTKDTVLHLHPTSRWLFKCWTDEQMADVIAWLLGQGIFVIVTSSPDERELAKAKRMLNLVHASCFTLHDSRFTLHDSRLIDLCGKTTIKQLGAIAERANLFFGVDSAPMHIAAALNTPVVALFGPSGAFSWGPWENNSSEFVVRSTTHGQRLVLRSPEFKAPYPEQNGIQIFGRHTVIQREWDCIPCGKDGCKGTKKSRCLEEVTPEEVKGILSEKLRITITHA
ncbi:MAG: putative lipopolysaccharide heptosyltransferase III [Nitrospirota bacterium]